MVKKVADYLIWRKDNFLSQGMLFFMKQSSIILFFTSIDIRRKITGKNTLGTTFRCIWASGSLWPIRNTNKTHFNATCISPLGGSDGWDNASPMMITSEIHEPRLQPPPVHDSLPFSSNSTPPPAEQHELLGRGQRKKIHAVTLK